MTNLGKSWKYNKMVNIFLQSWLLLFQLSRYSLYADPDPGGLPCNADQCIRNTVFTDHISENSLQHDRGEEAGGLVKLAATRNECI